MSGFLLPGPTVVLNIGAARAVAVFLADGVNRYRLECGADAPLPPAVADLLELAGLTPNTTITVAVEPAVAPVAASVGTVSTEEAAVRLGCTPRTITNMINRGDLAAERVGGAWRVYADEIDAVRKLRSGVSAEAA